MTPRFDKRDLRAPQVDRRALLRWAALSPLAYLAGDAGAAAEAAPAQRRRAPDVDRNAGWWDTWLIPNGAAVLPPPPPGLAQSLAEVRGTLIPLQRQRNAAARNLVAFWDEQAGIPAWTGILLAKVAEVSYNPVLASRGLALFYTAIADALIGTWYAKFQYHRQPPTRLVRQLKSISSVPGVLPSYPSEHAAVAAAAAAVLKFLFPGSQNTTVKGSVLTFDEAAESAASSRLAAGANYPSDLPAGADIGAATAALAILRAQGDGSHITDPVTAPVGPQYWVPTPPAFANPLLPRAGSWAPWVIGSGEAFLRPDPAPYSMGAFTPAFLAEVQAVADAKANLTDAQKQIATFWADGPGTVTPPGHWIQIGLQHVVANGLTPPRAARALALLGVGVADSAIACWANKYAYWLLRPVTAIRTIGGQPFTDPSWTSFIGTPPFPAYTSGHSTFSGCSAKVLEHLFPNGRLTDALGQSVPFEDGSDQAAVSRLYGGIHYPIDNNEGLVCGRAIADLVIARAQSDGA